MSTLRTIAGVYSAPPQRWVGDGFPVRSLFSYNSLGQHLSPWWWNADVALDPNRARDPVASAALVVSWE